jgi:phosphoglycerate dehydrogenase-like enzyme
MGTVDQIAPARAGSQADKRRDADASERYVATFTEDERQELMVAEAVIAMAILLHRVWEDRGLELGGSATVRHPTTR